MKLRQLLFWSALLFVVLIAGPRPVYAWGPAVHFHLGSQFLQLGLAGASLAGLLRRFPRSFLYGNVVADIVAAKSKLDFKDSPHNWEMIDTLYENSASDQQQAFTAGYQMHLAADTVAHNIFVPEYSRKLRLPENSAHAYWELRAEELVPAEIRRELKFMRNWATEEIDLLLEDSTPRTVLPFNWNWKIFNGILSFSSSKNWHKFSGFWGKYSRHPLEVDELEDYWQLSLKRMSDSIAGPNKRRYIKSLDPTGRMAPL